MAVEAVDEGYVLLEDWAGYVLFLYFADELPSDYVLDLAELLFVGFEGRLSCLDFDEELRLIHEGRLLKLSAV